MNSIDREKFDRKHLNIPGLERKIISQMNHRFTLDGVSGSQTTQLALARLRALYSLRLEDDGVLLPISGNEMGGIAHMLVTGFKTVLPTCLDYSYINLSDGSKKYTFENIGGGVSANAATLLNKSLVLYKALAEVHAPIVKGQMLVADTEAYDQIYQEMTGLNERQVLERAESTRNRIAYSVESGLLSIGLMSQFVNDDHMEYAIKQARQIPESTKASMGVGRSSLYGTMYERYRKMKGLIDRPRVSDYHNFVIDRVDADLQRYIALGVAARGKRMAIVDATAPEIARYYNIGADRLPVTPYIRIVDKYE